MDICQEGARILREYAQSFGSTIRGKPGKNAQGNQDAEAHLQWIMRTPPGTTHEEAIQMCKESDQNYERNAWSALLPHMREAVKKAYLARHSETPIFRTCLNECLGDDTRY